MNVLKTFLVLTVAAAAIPAAYADRFVGGELGYEIQPPNSTVSREQAQREYEAFRAHPVYFDGTVMIQGELGYVSANQGAFADRQPGVPHTHSLGNIGIPAAKTSPVTEAERRAYREQYIN